jgi:hypothetical protein
MHHFCDLLNQFRGELNTFKRSDLYKVIKARSFAALRMAAKGPVISLDKGETVFTRELWRISSLSSSSWGFCSVSGRPA